ncbi:pseudaminic acid cytidylyltransferase [Helicobacter suis]|uniref:pseudaminic acid cytidylyltransferase n=1 Tax=Helicobacter suis TaxID=104628 RepID=UPI0013D46A9F|nr:pseudaminic acid cytidylyltransferase [Helicobacter suis]
MQQIIALILARGGSKRIPLKNITPFLGKPLISHVIQAVLESKLFAQVVVSTDSKEIAQIAKAHGASVPFLRPKNLAGDFTPTLEVVAHAIKTLSIQERTMVCVLYGTSVFLRATYIKKALEMLKNNPHKKYAFACSVYSASPYRSFSIQENNPTPLFVENMPKRSQDLPPLYYDVGLFYLGQALHFSNLEPILAPHSIPLILPHLYVQDINTPEDLELATLKYTFLKTHAN